jgi:hypothetical protein
MDFFKTTLALFALSLLASAATADEVTFQRDGQSFTLTGEILVETVDGGILFRKLDGRIRVIQGDEVVSKVDNDDEVTPLTQRQMKDKILEELPEGFRVHTTKHFVIAYNTERAYAKWIGGLYERLFRGFISHWAKKRDYDLNSKPAFPLVAIIFRSKAEYSRFVESELGTPPGDMVAYYNLLTNRVTMYDLTSGLLPAGRALKNDRGINEILAAPNSLDMVATVIHEGTHQLMFNTGMQTRMSDTPLWINEGLAMFFETPDLNNSNGWRAIGQVNLPRLVQFRQEFNTRPANAFESMLSVDDRFKDPETAAYAYAEAWSFNYFLLNRHSEKYVEYLKFMSTKKPLRAADAEQRLAEFKQFLGEDLAALETEFLEYIQKVR